MRPLDPQDAFIHHQDLSDREQIEAFHRRQQADMQRREGGVGVVRRKPFHERYAEDRNRDDEASDMGEPDEGLSGGEEGWKDSDGDRLRDFGVDEEVEFYDEDDVPLGELLRRRRNGGVVS
jgi:palmitoyltransferase